MAAGRLQVEYQPRAENFIGGSKEYYREWADGPPARYRPNGSSDAPGTNIYTQPRDSEDLDFFTHSDPHEVIP
jgi:hypothetical protein